MCRVFESCIIILEKVFTKSFVVCVEEFPIKSVSGIFNYEIRDYLSCLKIICIYGSKASNFTINLKWIWYMYTGGGSLILCRGSQLIFKLKRRWMIFFGINYIQEWSKVKEPVTKKKNLWLGFEIVFVCCVCVYVCCLLSVSRQWMKKSSHIGWLTQTVELKESPRPPSSLLFFFFLFSFWKSEIITEHE